MSTRVNYDAIASHYDDRRRDYAVDERLATFVAEERRPGEQIRVLDIGCGTGKQLAADRSRYPRLSLTGVDLSLGMLRVAQAREATVRWLQGDAGQLPLRSALFDYVTNQFSYPHIGDKPRFIGEVFRVLKSGGRFVLTNIDPWSMTGWGLYRYFPEAFALDERDFLSVDRLTSLLTVSGFERVSATFVDRSAPAELSELMASAGQRHSASQLMIVSDAAYEAGLQRMRDDLARGVTVVHSPFVVVTIQADKPA